MRPRGLALLAATILLVALSPPPAATARADRTVDALRRRAFTVVAVVDTGINPYHEDFSAPELTTHPSRYVTGFPKDALSLELSLNETDLDSALEADAARWRSVPEAKPVWIPGTNIIAAVNVGARAQGFFDNTDHGTATASLAGGRVHGPGTNDILIVVVNDWDFGFRWAARQPWIDVITNSWGPLLPYPYDADTARTSRRATRSGKTVCFASGNSASPSVMWSSAGPSWTVNVGAVSKTTRGDHVYSNYPNDVVGYSHVLAATNDSVEEENRYAGTSFSAPSVCGQMARVISEARGRVGDFSEGTPSGHVVRGRRAGRGALKDGVITRREIERAVELTARPPEASPPDPTKDPWAVPAPPLVSFLRDGYGIVDRSTATGALRVLLGGKPAPKRPLEDGWAALGDQIRDSLWD